MSTKTKIQWCDSTINPIMGCGGCELYPSASTVIEAIDRRLTALNIENWSRGKARQILKELLAEAWQQLIAEIDEPGPGHRNTLSLSNIWHLRFRLESRIADEYDLDAGANARQAVEAEVKCYAAKLHLNKASSIVNPTRQINRGYAPTFEQVTTYPGRLQKAARFPDLLEKPREGAPWLNRLPRLIFVSDMGDALTRRSDFEFLANEVEAFQSEEGRRHLWLWLTKRPDLMRDFANQIGGMPANVCAMTTVTSHETLYRVAQLREVDAPMRGLSLEPLWTNIVDDLDLTGIDWVIIGGESGARANATPFLIEWVRNLIHRCREQEVAVFVKQLGSRPTQNGNDLRLKDRHGGDWNEWDESLRVRQFPKFFHAYRRIAGQPVEAAMLEATNSD